MAIERWDCDAGEECEHPDVDAFIEEVLTVCNKHGMTISHEDGHGAFEIIRRKPDEMHVGWLQGAHTKSKD